MASTIKLKGAEANIPTTADNFSSASVIRLLNKHATTQYVITLTTAGNAAIGTFTMKGGEVINLQKDSTDKIAVSTGTNIVGTPIAFGA
jgi:hypothetical protein